MKSEYLSDKAECTCQYRLTICGWLYQTREKKFT